MTTIAFDGKLLAGDKQRCYGDTPLPCTKVFRFENIVWGCSGDSADAIAFGDWIRAGMPQGKKPTIQNINAILVKDGECYQYSNPQLTPLKVESPFWAAGSGADYAMGAMEMGADAEKAVGIAMKWDINTGIGVDVISVGPEDTVAA